MQRDLDISVLGYEESKTKKKNRKKLLENLLDFAVTKGNSVSRLTEFETYSDMSRRTVYNYYQNAEEILIDLQIVVLHTYIHSSSYDIDETKSGYSNLEACLQVIVDLAYEQSDLLIFMDVFDNTFIDVYPDAKYMKYIRSLDNEYFSLNQIIDMGIKDGTIRNYGDTCEIAKSISRTIMDTVTRTIYNARIFETNKDANKAKVETVANILLAGLKAS